MSFEALWLDCDGVLVDNRFAGELIPEVFYQLQALKPAQMFNRFQCGFHCSKSNGGAIWRQYR